jgi:hypothetical protein
VHVRGPFLPPTRERTAPSIQFAPEKTAGQEKFMRIRYCSIVAIAMLVSAGTVLAADNHWAGTWKMDAAQSKLTGDTIHFASGTDGGMTYTEEGHASKFKMDGQSYKTWSGAEATWKKIDDNTFEENLKRNGVDIATVTWTVSPDGKALKVESKGTNPDGSSFDNTEEHVRVGGTKGLQGSWKSTKANMSDPESYSISDGGADALQWDIPAIKGKLHATLDGKDNAPEGPTVPQGLTIALTRVSPNVLKMTQKMNGEVTSYSVMTLSPDGKRITEVVTPAKEKVAYTEVWLKQ